MHGDDQPWPCPPDGPYYDDLAPGHVFASPPAVTLDAGIGAAYQAIAGEALPLVLDARLARAVTGQPRRLASPGLVLHLSVGASTVATKRVIANLFYRGVLLRRPVFEGETLSTTTRVLAMADGSRRQGRAPRGKALLGIVTTAGTTLDDAEPVLDYQRCPLIRLRGDTLPGHADDLGSAGGDVDLDAAAAFVPTGWDLAPLGPPTDWDIDETRTDQLRDVVDGATALVRLTHNVAAIHRDAEASPYPQRLVYGGHTVALAQASLSRMLPDIATVVGWHSCDHTGPVFEGDLLSSTHSLIAEQPVAGGRLRAFRTIVRAHRGDDVADVLDWVPLVFCR